ncbi:protein RETICULATA-RELATED 5, chloroplastic-like [Silene latifolia]|uniref:protein RETICULATA-RELATED 5, chloroplastic-like n=1 Tax=Silene latifolia TaxID=37657 RepID=UPI003D77DDCC
MSTLVQSLIIPSTIPIFKTTNSRTKSTSLFNNNNATSLNKYQCSLFSSSRNFFVALAVVADYGSTSHGRQRRGSMMVSGSYGHGSGSGSLRAVTLEKSKPELNQKTSKSVFEETLQFGDNGGGGNGGKKTGGGDNGGGGYGDDDDYFDFDDDDEDDGDQDGWFRKRISLDELYDKRSIEAVLQEWQKTLNDLPVYIRLACELGLISSAQLVKYLMNESRPSFTRAIYRALPKVMSSAFMGRIVADPAFLQKLLFEQIVTIACSVQSEFNRRGERMRQEWDLALINVLTVAACNSLVVRSLAPCCSFANTSRFNLHKLPNNIFEASYRHRRFDIHQRIQSFVCKAVQLSLLGFVAGAVQTALSNLCARNKQGRLSVQIPPANMNALGYGAFLGLYTNWRYQMVYGMDKLFSNRFEVIRVSLFFYAAFRILNAKLGEISRDAWLDTEIFGPLPQRDKVNRKKRITRNKVPENSLAS